MKAVRAVDTATDPEHQGRGLFTRLTQRGLEEPPTRMAVIAMGRYGGFELSYGSDADVMFVFDPDPDVEPGLDVARIAHDVAARLRAAAPIRDRSGVKLATSYVFQFQTVAPPQLPQNPEPEYAIYWSASDRVVRIESRSDVPVDALFFNSSETLHIFGRRANGTAEHGQWKILASAGATLRSLVDLVANLSDEPQGLELGEVAIAAASSPDLDLPIEDLDLSERPRNCLKRAQVNSIGELLEKSEDDLLAITNFGQKSLDEVIQKLDERGLSLRTRD